MKLPAWVFNAVNQTQRERDLHEALSIAWEALETIYSGENRLQKSSILIAKETMRRIEEMGK